MTIDINDINVSFICYYSWVLAMCQMDPCQNQTDFWLLEKIRWKRDL